MSPLPRLLRQLEQAAHDNDEKWMEQIFEELDRNEGWSDAVDEFIDRLGAREQDAIESFRTEAGDPFLGMGGSPDYSGGGARQSPTDPLAGVAKDASGIFCPANAAQWASILAVAGIGSGNPSLLWLLQEASGNAADSIGSFTGTASGTLTYQSSSTGWSRKGIKTSAGVAGTIANTAAGLPDVSTTSIMSLIYADLPGALGTTRTLKQLGTTFGNDITMQINNTPRLISIAGANSVTGTSNPGSAVRPLVLRSDRTNSRINGYSDQEKMTPAGLGGTGKNVLLGGDNTQTFFPDAVNYLYCAVFTGAAAELTDAQVKTLLQTLGWSIAW